MNHNNNNQNQNNQNKQPKLITVSFSFFVLFLITMSTYIYSKMYSVDRSLYGISLWPVVNKYQFYRIITHYFFYYGFFHMFVNLFFLLFITRAIERLIGTTYAVFFILQTLLLTSVIYLFIMVFLKYLFRILPYPSNFNFNTEIGISPLIFSIYAYYFSFGKNSEKTINILFIVEIRAKYSPLIFVIFIFLLTPNTSIFGHLSGIISAYCIKYIIGKYTMPSNDSVKEFEEKFCCFRTETFCISIIDRSEEFYQLIKEIEKNYKDETKEEIIERNENSGRGGQEMEEIPIDIQNKNNNTH